MTKDISIGDVVQVNPTAHLGFAGCFLLVTKTYRWGVQGFIPIPHSKTEQPHAAYLRLKWDEFAVIGRAEWMPDNLREDAT